MLEVDVQREVGGFSVDVRFDHDEGILILFGRSGAGKTTALRMLAGIESPSRGSIRFGGVTLFSRRQGVNVPIKDRGIGYIFQHHNLFPHMTARENIAYAAVDAGDIDRWAGVFEVSRVLDRHPGRLSGGEQQRIAIIRALVTKPRLLLMDEPMSAVDVGMRDVLLYELKRLPQTSGVPIVYVTHNVSEAYRLGDRVIVLERGQVIHDGVPIDVFQTPTSVAIAGLSGTENMVEGEVVVHHADDNTTELRLGEVRLHVPLCRERVGQRAVVAIRPEDILVALRETPDTSARNQLSGRIVEVRREASPSIMVEVCEGVTLRARMTSGSLESLRLDVGARVHLLIKAWSCHPVDRDGRCE